MTCLRYVFTKTDEHPCADSYFTGYDPEQCSTISYPDLSSDWTAACCADDAIEALLTVPGPAYYGYSTNPKWSRCEDIHTPSTSPSLSLSASPSTSSALVSSTSSVVMLLCTVILFMMGSK